MLAPDYYKQLAGIVDNQESVAALYRSLKSARFYAFNVQKFRDQWRGGEHWVQRKRPDMKNVLTLLSVEDDALLDELSKAGAPAAEPDVMIGKVVFTLGKDDRTRR